MPVVPEEPEACGVAYERLVNRFDALAWLRVNIMAVARKPPSLR